VQYAVASSCSHENRVTVNSSTGYLRRGNSSCLCSSLCRTRLLNVHCALWQMGIFVSCSSKDKRLLCVRVSVAGKLTPVNGDLPASKASVIATISNHDPQSPQTADCRSRLFCRRAAHEHAGNTDDLTTLFHLHSLCSKPSIIRSSRGGHPD
jgi:hypothetical protein